MKTRTKKATKTTKRVSTNDLVVITSEALSRAIGGADDGGGEVALGKTWRDSPPDAAA
jgi:hypothetical protein